MSNKQAETYLEILSIVFLLLFTVWVGTEVIQPIAFLVGTAIIFVVTVIGYAVLEKLK